MAVESLEERQYALDRERLEIDRRKLALEESWPRKWGSVVMGAAATISVAIITTGLGLFQQSAAERKASAAAKESAAQRGVDNDRTALDMYFRYVADKPEEAPHKRDHIEVIQTVASNRKLLEQLGSQQTRAAIEAGLTRNAGTADARAPSDVIAGLPDLKPQLAGHAYAAADFTGYLQYYAPRADEAERVTTALRNAGLRVPGTQAMPDRRSPARNEIRIYRAEHKPFADALAAKLKAAGFDFTVIGPIGGGRLPNGIIEVWLGRTATAGQAVATR